MLLYFNTCKKRHIIPPVRLQSFKSTAKKMYDNNYDE